MSTTPTAFCEGSDCVHFSRKLTLPSKIKINRSSAWQLPKTNARDAQGLQDDYGVGDWSRSLIKQLNVMLSMLQLLSSSSWQVGRAALLLASP